MLHAKINAMGNMENHTAATLPGNEDIILAYKRISDYIKQTPVLTCNTLNQLSGASLLFKCENFQKGGAFKYRGATNAILKLSSAQASKGVCTHSSGNHAQALALAAQNQGIDAHIVMPDNAPAVKVNAVRGYKGKITFCKPTLEAREATLAKIQHETGAEFIHPYNNVNVIEGQATCFYELLQQTDTEPDFVIAPLGGGGLLSGTLLAARYFSPKTRVIGAEPLMANDAWQSLRAGALVPSLNPQTLADGLKTSLGSITWPLIRDNVHDILTVSEDSIVNAMFWVWERMKIVIEPSAAVPLAAVLENSGLFRGKRVAIIFSGGNVDLKKLPWIS